MPIFKSKGTKITPASSEEMLLGSDCINSVFERPASSEVEDFTRCKTDSSSQLTPYMSTLKFELNLGLNGSNTKISTAMDASNECIEYTSLPPYKTRSQTVTLPMDMPVLNSSGTLLFNPRRKQEVTPLYHDQGYHSKVFKTKTKEGEGSFKSKRSFSATEYDGQFSTQGEFHTDTDLKSQDEEEIPTIRGKWFHDVDKLENLKLKFSLESICRERSCSLREWLSGPRKFYKCIQKQRRKKARAKENVYPKAKETCLEKTKEDKGKSQKHVRFPPEILLFSAIEDNSTQELKELILNHKVDINKSVNHKDVSPLHRAVELGFSSCVRVLLFHGADVNAKDLFGRSPLDTAVRTRHFECMVLLIESGANIADFTKQKLQEFRNITELSKMCYKSFELQV